MSDSTPVVGLAQFSLSLPGCSTLKERRSVIQSIRARIRGRFNVSIAEVGSGGVRQALLAVACVSESGGAARELIEQVIDMVLDEPEIVVLDQAVEFL